MCSIWALVYIRVVIYFLISVDMRCFHTNRQIEKMVCLRGSIKAAIINNFILTMDEITV